MTRTIRSYLAILLAAIVALTSPSMAVSRMADGPSGQMVLCTGAGPVTVYVDSDGQPVKAPHPCPDCMIAGLDIGLAPVVVPLSPPLPQARTLMPKQRFGAARAERAHRARGPPAAV